MIKFNSFKSLKSFKSFNSLIIFIITFLSVNSFNLIVLPDTQYYSAYWPTLFEEEMQWICACKDQLNIDYVTHVGDIVEHGDNKEEWKRATYAYTCLITNNIPFGFTMGNHDDSGGDDSNYNLVEDYFLPAVFKEDNTDIVQFDLNQYANNYEILTFTDPPIVIFHLAWNYNSTIKDWTIDLLNNDLSQYNAIIVTHYAKSDCDAHVTLFARDIIHLTSNVIVILNGHQFKCGGENMTYLTDDSGKNVPLIIQDYQSRIHGGNGWLRRLEFKSSNHTIERLCVHTYNVRTSDFELDDDSFFSFNYLNGNFEQGCPNEKQCTYRYSQGGIFQIHLFSWTSYLTILLVTIYRLTIVF